MRTKFAVFVGKWMKWVKWNQGDSKREGMMGRNQ